MKRIFLGLLCGVILPLAGCGNVMVTANPYPPHAPEQEQWQQETEWELLHARR